MNEDLRDWFGKSKSKDGKPGWVQADGSPCANEPDDKGKTPKCFSSQRLASLKAQGKKGEAMIRSAVRRKRSKDAGQQKKSGGAKPTMVRTFTKPEDYKKHPSGDNHESFQYEAKDHEVAMAQSQLSSAEKDIKALKKKLGKKEKDIPAWMQAKITDTEHNMDAAASYNEAKDPCWKGYKQVGMKTKNGKEVPNCVPVSENVSPIVKKILEQRQGALELQVFEEENKPTNPSLWAKMKAKAKAKFDVYPSAYANGWAAKEYKKAGGGWKTVSEAHDKMCKKCGKCPCECEEKGEKEDIDEAVRIPAQNGNVFLVAFHWRGKYMMVKMFFPELKRPSRQEVEAALEKAYPGSRVQRFDVSTIDYGDPYINAGKVNEEKEVEPPKERLKTDRNMFSISKDDREAARERLLAKTAAKRAKMKEETEIEEGAAWTKKEGQNKEGGLNEKGRKSYERENPGSDLKAPSKKVGNPRRASFCARMKGMKNKLTSSKTANDPDSRINKSLRAWNC